MIRRSHKKSRQGCRQCKRGHRKCDETKPSCIACSSTQKSCSYSTQSTPNDHSTETEFILYAGTAVDAVQSESRRSPHLTSNSPSYTAISSPVSMASSGAGEPYVNFLHLELFENMTSNALAMFEVNERGRGEWMATVFKYTFSYQYLMYEVLALSAFHLSTKNPSKASIYLAESATLQTKALSLFNSSNPTADQTKILPAFLFSGAIGFHFFCETFTQPTPTLTSFLTRFIQSIHLLRGVRTLIGTSWQAIQQSDISPILSPEVNPIPQFNATTFAFTTLLDKLSTSHTLSAYESKIYCEAVSDLLWVYNSNPSDVAENGVFYSRMVTTWPVRLGDEFMRFLGEKREVALVVLAHFAVLLHGLRGFWAVGGAGRVLLGWMEVGLGLGSEWEDWLVLPRGIVFAEDEDELMLQMI